MPEPFDPGAPKHGADPLASPTAGQIIAGGDQVQAIQAPFVTAVKVTVARDLELVKKNCLIEAFELGDGAFYHWTIEGTDKAGNVKKTTIEGLSINGAMIIRRHWRNSCLTTLPINEGPNHWLISAAFIDLQEGTVLVRPYKMSKKWKIYGKYDAARADDVRLNIGISKAHRNAMRHATPIWLQDMIIDQAKRGLSARIEKEIADSSLDAVRKRVQKALEQYGAKLEHAEYKYDCPLAEWDVKTLTKLSADLRALRDGVESADALFPGPQTTEPSGPGPESKTAAAGPKPSKGDASKYQPADKKVPPAKDTKQKSPQEKQPPKEPKDEELVDIDEQGNITPAKEKPAPGAEARERIARIQTLIEEKQNKGTLFDPGTRADLPSGEIPPAGRPRKGVEDYAKGIELVAMTAAEDNPRLAQKIIDACAAEENADIRSYNKRKLQRLATKVKKEAATLAVSLSETTATD